MTDTDNQPGARRGRLLDKVTGTTRRSRLTRLASATALAGALIAGPVLATAGPASATTLTTNPSCAIPAGASYQLVERYTVVNPLRQGGLPPRYTFSGWEAYSNGVYYNGQVEGIGAGAFDNPLQVVAARPAGVGVYCSTSSTPEFS